MQFFLKPEYFSPRRESRYTDGMSNRKPQRPRRGIRYEIWRSQREYFRGESPPVPRWQTIAAYIGLALVVLAALLKWLGVLP